jgi:hypothetical protein
MIWTIGHMSRAIWHGSSAAPRKSNPGQDKDASLSERRYPTQLPAARPTWGGLGTTGGGQTYERRFAFRPHD